MQTKYFMNLVNFALSNYLHQIPTEAGRCNVSSAAWGEKKICNN